VGRRRTLSCLTPCYYKKNASKSIGASHFPISDNILEKRKAIVFLSCDVVVKDTKIKLGEAGRALPRVRRGEMCFNASKRCSWQQATWHSETGS